MKLAALFTGPFALVLSWEALGDLTLAPAGLPGLGAMFLFLSGFVFQGLGSGTN